jgi:hypothetical protein
MPNLMPDRKNLMPNLNLWFRPGVWRPPSLSRRTWS